MGELGKRRMGDGGQTCQRQRRLRGGDLTAFGQVEEGINEVEIHGN